MKINLFEHTIVLTKKEMTAATRFGTKEYKDLQIAKSQNPGFQVVMSSRKVNRQCETYKGLTYAHMEKNIKSHDDEEETVWAEYMMYRETPIDPEDALPVAYTYKQMQTRFLSKYEAIAKFYENIA